MKRFRVKAVGLGLALAAGTAVAADGDWRAPGQSPPAAEAILPGAPGLLPPPMRSAPVAPADAPIWLPARQPAPTASAVTPAGLTTPAPAAPVVSPAAPVAIQQAQPQPTPWVDVPSGPRVGGNFGPLPAIPVPVDVPQLPATPPVVAQPYPNARVAMTQQPDPAAQPKAADPPPMIPPRVPEFLPPMSKSDAPVTTPEKGPPSTPPAPGKMDPPAGSPLPTPRSVDAPAQPPAGQSQPELPTAPPQLMIPSGALDTPGKHGTFGSMPIRLSRDYPPLRDLILTGHTRDEVTIAGDGSPDGGPMNRYFVQGEYLLWWMPGFNVPILGTTNANTALNGYLGEPGTTSLLGPGNFGDSTRSGFRVRAGAWLDDCGSCGIDGSFFFLGNQTTSAAFNPAQYPLITRPIYAPNLIPGTNTMLGENGEAVAVPGILNGSLSARAESQLLGADLNARKNLLNTCNARAEVFVGYRFLNLRENLTLTEDITVVGTGDGRVAVTDPVGTHVVVQDRFATQNYFNGGQVGGLYERRFGRWQVDARGSLALGDTRQVLDISGFQNRTQPGGTPMVYQGGLLAAGPNLGRFQSDHFSVVPELTLNVGYWVTPHLRLYAGYNFLLWTSVIRPGDQIDRVVDLASVPNSLVTSTSATVHPRPIFKQTDLVVNGIQFGVDWRW